MFFEGFREVWYGDLSFVCKMRLLKIKIKNKD